MKAGIVLCPVILLTLVALAFWRSTPLGPQGGATEEIYVSAASSLTDALERLAKDFERTHGIRVRPDFSSSGVLRVKIEAGAKVDAFLSASVKEMDLLEDGGYLSVGTRRDLLRNSLVCVVPAASTLRVGAAADLLRGEVRHIAIGDPEHVPAGFYGKQALLKLKLWDQLASKLVPCAVVRAALAQAEQKTVEAAIVYSSDASLSRKAKVAFAFPDSSHMPIVYSGAVLKRAPQPEKARKILDFLASASAQQVFAEYGFEPITDEVE